MEPANVRIAARRLTEAIASADTPALLSLYASNAVIWHSTDQIEMTVGQVVDLLRAIGKVSRCTIEVVNTLMTAEGFVQTQKNSYQLKNGMQTSFYAALVVTLDHEGLISRCEEYLDSAGLAPLVAALSP